MKPKIPQQEQQQPKQEQQPPQSNQPLLLLIDAKIIEGVFQTLGQLPYAQVEPLMTALRMDLTKNNPQQ